MKSLKLLTLAAALTANLAVQAQVNPNLQGLELYGNVIKDFKIDSIWSRGITGRGVTVGVIDQGFDISHADLKTKIAASRNFVTGGTVTWGSHGTAMASIIAGARNNVGMVGIAPDAMLLLAQVGVGGTNSSMSEAALIRALDWTSSMGASVINLSASMTIPDSFRQSLRVNYTNGIWFAPSYSAVFPYSKNLYSYVLATGKNSIIVTSAGNQGLPYASYPGQFASTVNAAGNLMLGGRMIVVGAVDASNTIASFSNRAGHICQLNFTGQFCVDKVLTRDFFVVAPGVSMVAAQSLPLTTKSNPITMVTGTSPAAAYVSGGMALMRQAWPQLKPEQLVQRVLTTTTDLGTPGVDNVYGRGLVNFEAATRPTGRLIVAQTTKSLDGTPGTGVALAGTGINTSSSLAHTLTTNSVLTSVQIVDGIGRNYSADLSQVVRTRSMTYDSLSPYLSYTGYLPVQFDIGFAEMTTMVAATGSAVELKKQLGAWRFGLQIGSVNERSGFIGNYGSGALDLGSSSTNWQIVSAELPIRSDLHTRLSFGQGFTRVNNAPLSMVEILSGIRTDTYQLGLTKSNLFNHQDSLSIGVGAEPRIKSGQAQITAVTGYNYKELEDGSVIGDPIVTQQRVNLKQSANHVLYAGYRTPVAKNGFWFVSAAGNSDSYKLGVNFTWMQ